MYKVMIVDDEPIIRKTIKKLVEDTRLGLDIVFEAKNAIEAINYINEHDVDIIISDMKMPEADGVMLMEHIHFKYPNIKIIIVSGYSNFEYMKKAITFNAFEYLLKPVTFSEINDVLRKVIDALDKENKLLNQDKHEEQKTKVKKEHFFQDIAYGRIADRLEIIRTAHDIGIEEINMQSVLIILGFRQLWDIAHKKYDGNVSLLVFCIENILNEIIEFDILFKSDDKSRVCIITHFKDFFEEEISKYTAKINSYINSCLGLTVVAGSSLPFIKLENIYEAYKQAEEAILFNPISGGFSICYFKNIRNIDYPLMHVEDELRILQKALDSRSICEVNACFEKIKDKIIANNATIKECHTIYVKIFMMVETNVKKIKNMQFQKAFSYFNDFGHVASIFNIECIAYNLYRLTNILEEAFKIVEEESSDDVINEVIDYIETNYHLDISLVDIATRYHYEPTYFSKLFKTKTNKNFIEYLISVRMEKACNLLKNSILKVNEIGLLVGYENHQYFCQLFKKYTGMTPSEYRENIKSFQQKPNIEIPNKQNHNKT